MVTDWDAEISKVEASIQDLKAQAHDQGQMIGALDARLRQEQVRLQQLEVNLAAATTVLQHLRQLQAEEAERGKAGSGSVPPEAGPGTASQGVSAEA